MKNISDILRRGNLTPKERILISIHDEIYGLKTGKRQLSDADTHALTDGWTAKSSQEAREYNKYLKIWDTLRFLKIDAQTTYLNAIISLQDAEKICLLLSNTKISHIESLEKHINEEAKSKALEELLSHTGVDYDQAVHEMTFNNLPQSVRDDVLALDPDTSTSNEYFSQEETLYEFLKGKSKLSAEEINLLTDEVHKAVPWELIRAFRNKGLKPAHLFQGYFASVPTMYFMEKIAKKEFYVSTIIPEIEEKLYSIENLEAKFKEVVRQEIKNGLFVTSYQALCNSSEVETCNNISTKEPHATVIEKYVVEKRKVEKQLQKYIEDGVLKVEERTSNMFDAKISSTMIAGESLYYGDVQEPFFLDFKRQIQSMLPFAYGLHFIQAKEFIKHYRELLTFQKIFEQSSDILEYDLSFFTETYIAEIEAKIKMLNDSIVRLSDVYVDAACTQEGIQYFVEGGIQRDYFDIEGVTPMDSKQFQEIGEKINSLWGRSVVLSG